MIYEQFLTIINNPPADDTLAGVTPATMLLVQFARSKDNVPDAVRLLRSSTGLTQVAFAAKYGIPSRRTVQNWETGVNAPPPWALNLLAYAVVMDQAGRCK